MSLETELIQWLKENLPTSDRLKIGLGDDAAVLARAVDADMVITTDLLTDGVHFLTDEHAPEQIGHKTLGVNLSDLAAMAARPVAAFVSITLPRSGTRQHSALQLAKGIYRGLLPLAVRYDVTIAGGDTNTWDGGLAINITAIGQTTQRGPLTRSGGQPGDQLLVTGNLGGSILGRHLDVEPRVEEALLLHEKYELHAGMDISDGLALDCSRLAKASGFGAVLDLATIPVSSAATELCKKDKIPAVEHALHDGEDFELLLAVPSATAQQLLQDQPLGIPISRVGQLIPDRGLWQLTDDNKRVALPPRGFEHRSHE